MYSPLLSKIKIKKYRKCFIMSLELSHIFKEEETILQITMGILKKKLRAVKEKPRKKNYNEEKGEKPT